MALPLLVPAHGMDGRTMLGQHPTLRHKSAPVKSQAHSSLVTSPSALRHKTTPVKSQAGPQLITVAAPSILLPRGTTWHVRGGAKQRLPGVEQMRAALSMPIGCLPTPLTLHRPPRLPHARTAMHCSQSTALASGAHRSPHSSMARRPGPAPPAAAGLADSAAKSASPAAESADPSLTVLLFKHDLRVSDHPALLAASASPSPLLPLFVFDSAVLRTLPLHLLAPLLASLSALRSALRERGSDLAVRIGNTAAVVLQEAKNSGMGLKEVLVEEEVESTWQDVIGALEEALGGPEGEASSEGGGCSAADISTDITRWRTPLFQSFEVPGSAQYGAFLESCSGALAPLEAPQKLPPFPSNIDPGEIPSLSQILKLRGKSLHHTPEPAAEPLTKPAASEAAGAAAAAAHPLRLEAEALLRDWACLSHDPTANHAAWSAVIAGERSALAVLNEYLFGTQTPSPPGGTPSFGVPSGGVPSGGVPRSEGLKAAMESEETCPFASLLSILGPALSLGTLSHRQVHALGLLALGAPLVYPQHTGDPTLSPPTAAPLAGPSSLSGQPSAPLQPASVPGTGLLQALFPDPLKRAPRAAVRHALAAEWHHLLAAHSQGAHRGYTPPSDPNLWQTGASTDSSTNNGSSTSTSTTGASPITPSGSSTPSSSSSSAGSGDAVPLPETFFSNPETGGVPPPPGVRVRHWRWRGILVEYAVADLTGYSDTDTGHSDTGAGYSDTGAGYSDETDGNGSAAAGESPGPVLGFFSRVFGGEGDGESQGVDAAKGDEQKDSQGGEQLGADAQTSKEGKGQDTRGEDKPLSEDKPPVLLVHGFGAFWQHYRDVMLPLAYQGHRVYALTLPGFGRSEKPAVAYSQYFWNHCAADFIADVIGAPAVVAGNSIGGYTVASLAADHPQLARSVVLFNSAGKIDPTQSLGGPTGGTQGTGGSGSSTGAGTGTAEVTERERERARERARLRHSRGYAASLVNEKRRSGPPRGVVWAFSRALFAYLRSSTGTVIKRCYPNFPGRADEKLVREILRAATDPGAVEVVESVFFLPKPRPLNVLLDVFGGPVLVLQGRNDPLNDAVARANAIRAACPSAAVHFLDAGHCPHDEVPEEVSSVLLKWAASPWSGGEGGGGANSSASGEEGPLEVLTEEAMLGAGIGRK